MSCGCRPDIRLGHRGDVQHCPRHSEENVARLEARVQAQEAHYNKCMDEIHLAAKCQRDGLAGILGWIDAAKDRGAALARLGAEIAQAVQLIPSLRSIGELCDHWTDAGEAELADCLTGLRDHLNAAIAAAEEALKP